MKKLILFASVLLLVLCCFLLVGCDDTAAPQDDQSTPKEETTTVEVPSVAEPGDGLNLSASHVSYGASYDPMLQIHYTYGDFDFATYKNPVLQLYYKDVLLGSREMGTISSNMVLPACYGRVTVRVVAKDSAGQDVTLKEGIVPVYVDEYNFAAMNGSMPVLYFSLDLFSRSDYSSTRVEYQNNGLPVMKNAPTFVALERVNSYDWDQLPEGVYSLPALKEPSGDFFKNNDIMAAYIRELYEINPDSHFNFYCVDNYPELILKFFVAQGIDNFHATLISDGTSSAACFQRMTYPEAQYGANADEVYGKLANEWKRIKAAAAAGDANYLKDVFMGHPADVQVLENYAFVIATLEDNVDWWLARKSLFTGNANSAYILDLLEGTNLSGKNEEKLQTNVMYPSFGTMFGKLAENDAAALKRLYKFDSDAFSSAGDKEILMVLGTSTADEGDLENYLTYLQSVYGDTHKIFYKGHPGWPTALDENKQAMLERLGVVDIESYIAAEIILFYCPDIYLAGFNTSTFYSAQDGRILTVFITEEAGAGMTYTSATYMNPVSSYGSTYEAYAGCYVVEYAGSDRVDIYNPTTKEVTTVVQG